MTVRSITQAAAGFKPKVVDLATAEFNVSPINYVDVSPVYAHMTSGTFSSDGTKMYIVSTITDIIYEYDLSTAWDLSTVTHNQNSSSITAQGTFPNALFFKSDGTKMYVPENANDNVNEYNLSTAWDISTLTYSQSFSIATEAPGPTGVWFKPDGTIMYVVCFTNDAVFQYTLSTAWDVSTASYASKTKSVATEDSIPTGIFLKPDGTKMWISGNTNDRVYEYSLSTAWDVSTASYSTSYLANFDGLETSLVNVYFKSDGTGMFTFGGGNRKVYKHDLSTAWDLSTATFNYPSTNYFRTATQDNSPQALFFKPDGTIMYQVGAQNDKVSQYSLSTAWDITTASYSQAFSVLTQTGLPRGLFFKPDGTKMYVSESITDTVLEYDLSTAWDVSTASYSQNFSVVTQENNPIGLWFKDDGAKMFVVGTGSDAVQEYNLSTAWDISTASHSQGFSVATEETSPLGLSFTEDGRQMLIVGTTNRALFAYDLSTAWDVSTASYSSTFNLPVLLYLSPYSCFVNSDKSKIYISNQTSPDDGVYALDL